MQISRYEVFLRDELIPNVGSLIHLVFSILQSVQASITNSAVPAWNKLRLVMLYALRYQKSQANSVASLIKLALENGVSREDARVS